MAKKTHIKVRLVPESNHDSKIIYYAKKPTKGEKAKNKLKLKKYNPNTRKHEFFVEKKLEEKTLKYGPYVLGGGVGGLSLKSVVALLSGKTLAKGATKAGLKLVPSRFPPSPYFFPAFSRIRARIATTVLFPFDPVTAMIDLRTDLEKMSMSPVIATPCSAASANPTASIAARGLIPLTPGLIASTIV